MLRPDAAPFYEEDAMLGMKAGVEFGQFETAKLSKVNGSIMSVSTQKMQSLEVFVRPR